MKFGTVRIHFLGEDFAAVAVEVASCFFVVVLFPTPFVLSVVGYWHKLYAYFFASYFQEQLVSILC